MGKQLKTSIAALEIPRPMRGLSFSLSDSRCPLPLSGEPAWTTEFRPFSSGSRLDIALPLDAFRVHFVGVFSIGPDSEPKGSSLAKIQFLEEGRITGEMALVRGQHCVDATGPARHGCCFGDGTSLETLGMVDQDGERLRVDVLTVDLPSNHAFTSLRLAVPPKSTKIVIFDAVVELVATHGCPFHQRGGGVSLTEVATAARLGDRVKFQKAIDQLVDGMRLTSDLDEARGQALTFLAVVTSAMLELGGGRDLHRVQLDVARALDRQTELDGVIEESKEWVQRIAAPIFAPIESPSAYLVDRALAIVDRNYAREITDDLVAGQLGLSTSHFRFLFKQATGQPFHKYLMGLRLEKAKSMLVHDEVAVSEVARAVGFTGLAHFSRAFTQRFQASPTTFRRGTQ